MVTNRQRKGTRRKRERRGELHTTVDEVGGNTKLVWLWLQSDEETKTWKTGATKRNGFGLSSVPSEQNERPGREALLRVEYASRIEGIFRMIP